eukprot:scaffold112554_cov63-Phaeocystis_antarctica.AAC.3
MFYLKPNSTRITLRCVQNTRLDSVRSHTHLTRSYLDVCPDAPRVSVAEKEAANEETTAPGLRGLAGQLSCGHRNMCSRTDERPCAAAPHLRAVASESTLALPSSASGTPASTPAFDKCTLAPCVGLRTAGRGVPKVNESPWRSLLPSDGSRREALLVVCRRGRAFSRATDRPPPATAAVLRLALALALDADGAASPTPGWACSAAERLRGAGVTMGPRALPSSNAWHGEGDHASGGDSMPRLLLPDALAGLG